MVNKAALIQSVRKSTDISSRAAASCIDAVIEALAGSIIRGERIELRGLGSFSVKKMPGKKVAFPNISAAPEYVRIIFKPSKNLKLAARKRTA